MPPTHLSGRPFANPIASALYWAGPPILLMAVIFWLGSDRGSADQTRSLLERLLEHWPKLLEWMGAETINSWNVVIRKLGHFSGYGLLGLLNARCFRGLRGTLTSRGWIFAWLAATIWASVDEFHQSFSASRGASPGDVLLDAAGAAFGILVYTLCLRRCRVKN